MTKLNLLLCFLTITFLSGCFKEDDVDVQKTVLMTVYPETGYGGYFFSEDVYGEFLLFSDDDNQEKTLLTNGGDFTANFTYEPGYEYKIEARKTFLANPPQDGSSIQYDYIKTISKTKVVTQNSEQQLVLEVNPKKVGLITRDQDELQQALFVKQEAEVNFKPLLNIEGFSFEEGHKYKLLVKKVVEANPYAVKYILIDILSKE